MRFLYSTDLHGKEQAYAKLFDYARQKDINTVVIGGDIGPHVRGDVDTAIAAQRDFLEHFFVDKVSEFGGDVYVIMGNDDFACNLDVLGRASSNKLLKLFHNRAFPLGKYSLIGYSFVNEHPFRLKDWEKMDDGLSRPLVREDMQIRTVDEEDGTIEDDLNRMKKYSEPKKTVYVMHAPPYNTKLDITSLGKHVGSRSIRRFIEQEQPPLTLHGHIHESFVNGYIDAIGATVCVNPGSQALQGKLNLALVDLDRLHITHKVI